MEKKIKSRPKITKEYYLKCLECGQEVKGFSESQVLYNFDTHFNRKHALKESQRKPAKASHSSEALHSRRKKR